MTNGPIPPFPSDRAALLALALGELDAETANQLRRKLAENQPLSAEMTRTQRLVDALRTGGLVSPPDDVAARAKSLVSSSHSSRAPSDLLGSVVQAVATLIFDSRAANALAGFRNAPALNPAAFHLTYESPHGEVDLQIQSGTPGADVRVLGQVEADQPASLATLSQQQLPIREAPIDNHGMFSFEAPPGNYELAIILNQGIIRIPSIDLA